MVTFAEPLSFSGVPTKQRDLRLELRRQWLVRALEEVASADVVFADPGNGIRLPAHKRGRHLDKSEKYACTDELAEFAQRGQALVVYHHADRSVPVPIQAARLLSELGQHAGTPIAAVRASRGTTRIFLVTGAGAVAQRLRTRLTELEGSQWSSELTVNWSSSPR